MRSYGRVSLGVIALAVTALVQVAPARAAAFYDSQYAGQSAFVSLAPGETKTFQVFFQNTGTESWVKGTSTQVDLAACKDDKVTCNVAPEEAAWNSGWLSSTRYATTAQSTVASGQIGTFAYTIVAPSSAAQGTYHFNGDLVVSATGMKIHPEGYFQDATVVAPPAPVTKPQLSSAATANLTQVTLTFSENMSCSSIANGDYTIKDASGNVVNATKPTGGGVSQIRAAGGIPDCKTATLTFREFGSVTLSSGLQYTVVINSGPTSVSGVAFDPAFNNKTFTASDTTAPSPTTLEFLSSTSFRVTFNEPMQPGTTALGIGNTANYRVDGGSGTTNLSGCAVKVQNTVAECTTSFIIASGSHTVEVVEAADTAGNRVAAGSTVSATYPPVTKRPVITNIAAGSPGEVVLTFDQKMNTTSTSGGCANASNYAITKADGSASGASITTIVCSSTTNKAYLTVTGLSAGTGYTITATGVVDAFGNFINPNPTSFTFVPISDSVRPTVLSVTTPTVTTGCDVATALPCSRTQFTVNYSESMTMTSATSGALNTAAYSLGSAQDLSGNQITVSSCNAVDDKNVASTVSVTCALSGVITAGTYNVTIGSGSNIPADLTGNQVTPAPTSVTVTYK